MDFPKTVKPSGCTDTDYQNAIEESKVLVSEKLKSIKARKLKRVDLEIFLAYFSAMNEILEKRVHQEETLAEQNELIHSFQVSVAIAEAINAKRKELAQLGGNAKSIKTESCRLEFLRMVDEHSPAWDKTREGLAEAVLKLKPAIVQYAKENQNSVITASTGLPKKWLEEHWGLEKRIYRKRQTKQN